MFIPLQSIGAAPAPIQQEAAVPELEMSQPVAAEAGPKPAAGGQIFASQEQFAGSDAAAFSSNLVNVDENSSVKKNINPFSGLFAPKAVTPAPTPTYAFNGGLEIEPITAYNLIVDSNVLAPSSYGPSAATLGAKYCNKSGATMSNVWAYIGNYTGSGTLDGTPGVYPIITPAEAVTNTGNTDLATAVRTDYGGTVFSLEHEGGSVSAATDASRYIGTLLNNECRTVYWLVSYPRKAELGSVGSGNWVSVTGGVKAEDDLWLPYDFWGKAGGSTSYYTRYVTLRNEISAMANKIWPNGDNKVPDQYVSAIQQILGWDTWTPNGSGTTAYPGETVTSQGIWYDLGNVGAGFDNNYDLVPDRNLWVQPIGDAGAYDPGCFRLVKTYGLIIVKLNTNPESELVIPFVDQTYFGGIPDNNTGAVGLVFYEYIALDGACTAGLTPYQEVASGYDNEKFNADFGAGIPPLQSRESNMTFDKTGEALIGLSGTMNYSLTFTLPDIDAGNATSTVTVGSPAYGMPLTYYDTIPAGLEFIANTANFSTSVTMTNYTTPQPATVLVSKDSGLTWYDTSSPTDQAAFCAGTGLPTPGVWPCNMTSTSPNNLVMIQWQLTNGITSPANGPAVTGKVEFDAKVPGTYTGKIISNTGCMKLGNAPCFVEDTHKTLVLGDYAISGTVFCDDGSQYTASGSCSATTAGGVLASGLLDTGGSEPGIPSIGVTLYYDANNDNLIDSGDTVVATMDSLNYGVVNGYIDTNNDGFFTIADTLSLPNITMINDGAGPLVDGLDINGDGVVSGADDSTGTTIGTIGGYRIVDGRIDINADGTPTDTLAYALRGMYNFGRLPTGNYLVKVDSADTQLPTGYTNTNTTLRNADISTVDLTAINYGFAPALSIVKRLNSPAVTVIGQTADVNYSLFITNNIPGGGGATSKCTYRIYSSIAHELSTDPIPTGGGTLGSNKNWQTTANALGAPDGAYSFTKMSDNNDELGLSGFNSANQGGTIDGVKYVLAIQERAEFQTNDHLFARVYYGDTQISTDITNDYGATYFSSAAGSSYTISKDIFALRAWTWSDFTSNLTEMQLIANKGGGTTGDVNLDAAYFEVTTNATCNDTGQVINPMPLTDVFESYYMSFITANPPISSSSTVGSGTAALTTLTWDNVGPLYPGQTKEIKVTFHADQITAANTYLTAAKADNTASITTATFGNGRDTNDVSASTPVGIVASRDVSGYIWYDKNPATPNGWQATNGYEATDGKIPNVTVELWACQLADGTFVTDTGANVTGTSYCTDTSLNGTWIKFATDTTDSNGYYSFTGLYQSYYRIIIDQTTLPLGATPTADANHQGNNDKCGGSVTCDYQMGEEIDRLQGGNVVNLDTSAGPVTNINFGFDYPAGIYGNVWENLNGDRVKDSTDLPLSGITVNLYVWNDAGTLGLVEAGEIGALVTGGTDTTDAYGDFFFANATITGGAKYVIQVDTTTLPAGNTWTVTDENDATIASPYDDPISGNNEYNYIGVTAVANANTGAFEFGVTRTGSYRIGDTLFYDWNGNATQDSPADEGIPNITVKLYSDLDSDGIADGDDILTATVTTFAHKVINGKLDLNNDGVIDTSGTTDNGTDDGCTITNGLLSGCTTYYGVAVISGYVDIDGDGVTAGDTGDAINIGGYTFNKLSARDFVVVVDTADAQFPTLLTESKDPDESGVCTICNSRGTVLRTDLTNVSLPVLGFVQTEDFGYYPFGGGSIGDTVFKDVNGNGVQLGTLETGIPNITVTLQVDLNGDGNFVTIRTTSTDINGNYLFSNLPTSLSSSASSVTYRVVVDDTDAQLPKDTFNIAYEPSTVTTYTRTLTNAAPTSLTADFGFAALGAFGDTIYWDANANGTQDLTETGIPNVIVYLYKFVDGGNGDGSWDAGDTFTVGHDTNGNGIRDAEVFTDSNGNGVWTPAETLLTDVNGNGIWDSGDTFTDTDGDTLWDAAEAYIDSNGDGVYSAESFTDSDGDGKYTAPEAYLDIANNGYTSGDPFYDVREGRYQPNEAISNTPYATAVTDASGKYIFSGLPIGKYVAVVEKAAATIDIDLTAGVNNITNPIYGRDLTADPDTDGVACADLTSPAGLYEVDSHFCDNKSGMQIFAGTSYMGADFGYKPLGSFGDTLWIDTNNNGIVDLGEHGISEVDVKLYTYTDSGSGIPGADGNGKYDVEPFTDTNGNGVWDSGEPFTDLNGNSTYNQETLGAVQATKTTDLNGNFLFTNIADGNYVVKVDTSDTNISTLITTGGLRNTYDPDGTGTTLSTNNSATSLNIALGAVTRTGTCTTLAGCDGDATDALFLDADFGYNYIGTGNLSGTVCLEPVSSTNGSIDIDAVGVCGTTFTDIDGAQSTASGVDTAAGEVAYKTVTVYLYRWTDDGDGLIESGETVQIGSTTTGTNGDYSFPNIPVGTYYVVAIGAPQTGLELTTQINDSREVTTGSQERVVESNPSGPDISALQVVNVPASGDTTIENVDFAFSASASYDYGDLPEGLIGGINYRYSTTLSGVPDGARHQQPTGGDYTTYLGSIWPDVDTNGKPGTRASGDGVDEDGISVPAGQNWGNASDDAQLNVRVTGSGWLVGWMDLNKDGVFGGNETIIDQAITTNGLIAIPGLVNLADGTYYARFRLFTTEPPVAEIAYSGVAVDGEVEDYVFSLSGGVPTPVTLSYFHAQRDGSAVNFEWSTATETGNMGFNLYIESNGQMTQINNELIPSNAIDSIDRQDYTFSANVAGNTFYIEDVSITNELIQNGPYQLGEKYGEKLDADKIDLAGIQAENEQKVQERKEKDKLGMGLPSAALQSPVLQTSATLSSSGSTQLTNTLNVKVNKSGIYRLTYEMIKQAGLDLKGVPSAKVALTNRDQTVPIYVEIPSSARIRGVFGPGSFIEFYGQALDTTYTDTNVYVLQVIKTTAPRIQATSAAPARGLVSPAAYTETVTVNRQRVFTSTAPGNDPWYDTRMLAYTTLTTYPFTFEVSSVSTVVPATLDLIVWGGTDWPAANPDHHLQVGINGVSVADEKFNGLIEKRIKVTIPAGTLHEGTNTINLTLPGDTGVAYDLIHLNKFDVTYQRAYQAQNGNLTFTATGKIFTVDNLPSKNVIVYRQDRKGIMRLSQVKVIGTGSAFTASFAGTNAEAKYFVTTVDSIYAPVLEAARPKVNLNRRAEYLIISHPNFIGGLDALVQARKAQGLTVNVVDVTDLYAQYGYGIFDPQGIQKYIAYAAKNLGVKYVLLVGGDTYDYRNFTGKNSISFIPSIYITTGPVAKFVPADPVYADTNLDSIPDIALGRFPVRTSAELEMMVSKTLSYANKDYGRSAAFTSDTSSGGISFKNMSLSFRAGLPKEWEAQNIKDIHMEDLSIAEVRAQLITAMNNGVALVDFAGHSAPTTWGYPSLFNTTDAAALTNNGRPFVAVQWGCWNTYYIDPVNNNLVQKMLLSGNQGAAAVFGAITITNSESEQLLGELFMPRLTTPGMTMGIAMRDAKLALAKKHPELQDVLLGWTLMGDPALMVEPAK